MITASARLVRIPATICGSAAGSTSRRIRSRRGMPYERAVSISVGSIPRTPSIVFSRIGNRQKKAMNATFCLLPMACSSTIEIGSKRRRRHRAPVLDVRHRQRSAPTARARSGCRARRRATAAIPKPSEDPLQARHDVRAELGEEPEVAELDEDRREPREVLRVGARRPALPGGEDRERDGDLRADLQRPVRARRSRDRRPLRGMPAERAALERRHREVDARARGSRWRARARRAGRSARTELA